MWGKVLIDNSSNAHDNKRISGDGKQERRPGSENDFHDIVIGRHFYVQTKSAKERVGKSKDSMEL